MFNFDWFRKPRYAEQTSATDDMLGTGNGEFHPSSYLSPPAAIDPMVNEGYTVGVDNNGKTVLRVDCNGSTITTTMNAAATRKMIRLLKATLDSENESNN